MLAVDLMEQPDLSKECRSCLPCLGYLVHFGLKQFGSIPCGETTSLSQDARSLHHVGD